MAIRLRQLVESALARLEVLPWTDACAVVYGRIRAVQARNGRPLGLMDLLIASHALSESYVLVNSYNTV
jgi:tRNA(fMet)-specific endonuclease VapC